MRPQELSELQRDAIQEVASIGAGNAATALSQLVDHRIELEVPSLELVAIPDIPTLFGGPEQLVAAVYQKMLGDLSGGMVFLASRPTALALVDMLRNRAVGSSKSFGNEEEAHVAHTASVLMSAYLNAVGRLADLNILPGSPAVAFDMVGGILEAIAMEIGLRSSTALVLRTEFRSDGDETVRDAVDVYLLFLPDEEALEILLGRLGMS